MSFPNIIYGRYGDEKVAQSAAIGSLPLGQRMILPDGREFRHARAQTSAALTPAKLCVSGSAIPDHGCGTADNLLANTAAIGATTVVVTAGGTTAIAANYYVNGYLGVRDDVGEGYLYRISANNSTATGSTCTITLEPTEGLKVALGASATVSLRRNRFGDVLVRATGSAMVGPIAGVSVIAASAGWYTWLQTKGVGMGLVAGTVAIIGQPVYASTELAGAIAGFGVASTGGPVYNEVQAVGHCHGLAAASTEEAIISWEID